MCSWDVSAASMTSSSVPLWRGEPDRGSTSWSATSSICCRCVRTCRGTRHSTSFLARVRRTVTDGLEHQDYPFSLLARRLQGNPDPSRPPLFQAMFAHQKIEPLDEQGLAPFALGIPGARLNLHGLAIESIAFERQTALFDLTMMTAREADRLCVAVEYSTDLFRASTIDRMAASFRNLLEAIVADPGRRIADLPLLSESERHQVLGEWASSPGITLDDLAIPHRDDLGLVHRLIEVQAARTPQAVAVTCSGGWLTYFELNARANCVARRLRALGVGPEVLVGLCAGRSAEMVVGLLAVLKAGGAYVPLDPAYPAERLAFMLQDARVAVLLTQEEQLHRLPDSSASVVCVDRERETIALQPDGNLSGGATLDNLAYVIYTSGSTGKPKGVLISHRNLVHSTHARRLYYRQPVRSYLLLSSFAFDSSVAGIFWTLCQGGKLVLPCQEEQNDPLRLAEMVQEHQVTHLLCVPSLYASILDQAPVARMASLDTAIVAGEPCPRGLAQRHRSMLPQVALHNEYGPTEATVWCTVHRCGSAEETGQVPIGKPIANSRIYVLDAYQQPVPVRVAGELYVGGEEWPGATSTTQV